MIGKSLVVALRVAALLTAGVLSLGQAHASHVCQDAIADYLESLKIDVDDVTSVNVYVDKPGSGGQPVGYTAWVSMKTCRGKVVINLSPACRVQNAYTRGDCSFENLTPR